MNNICKNRLFFLSAIMLLLSIINANHLFSMKRKMYGEQYDEYENKRQNRKKRKIAEEKVTNIHQIVSNRRLGLQADNGEAFYKTIKRIDKENKRKFENRSENGQMEELKKCIREAKDYTLQTIRNHFIELNNTEEYYFEYEHSPALIEAINTFNERFSDEYIKTIITAIWFWGNAINLDSNKYKGPLYIIKSFENCKGYNETKQKEWTIKLIIKILRKIIILKTINTLDISGNNIDENDIAHIANSLLYITTLKNIEPDEDDTSLLYRITDSDNQTFTIFVTLPETIR